MEKLIFFSLSTASFWLTIQITTILNTLLQNYYNTNYYTCTSKCTKDKTIPSQYCNYCKQTEDILQTVPDYKKSGNTTNNKTIQNIPTYTKNKLQQQ